MNGAAFDKLQQEISLKTHELQLPAMWQEEGVKLYSGLVPLASGAFHKVVVREGRTPHVDARDFSLKQWTERRYYEICTNPAIYEYVESGMTASAAAAAKT